MTSSAPFSVPAPVTTSPFPPTAADCSISAVQPPCSPSCRRRRLADPSQPRPPCLARKLKEPTEVLIPVKVAELVPQPHHDRSLGKGSARDANGLGRDLADRFWTQAHGSPPCWMAVRIRRQYLTFLPAQVQGRWFYLYLILDLFSRKVVGFELHDTDSADHAAHLA